MGGDFNKAVGWTMRHLSSRGAPLGGIIGDSITKPDYTNADQVTPTSATSWNKSSNGIMAWALALSGQRVDVPAHTNVWSFPGEQSTTILANLPAFLAQMSRTPGFVVIECGTNDVVAGRTYDQIKATFAAIIDFLTGRGIRALFVPILPRLSSSFTQPRADIAIRVNGWLAEVSRRANGMVAVAMAALGPLSLPGSTLYEPQSSPAVMYDGTHPNTLGAFYIGEAVAAIINQWYPPLDLLPTTSLAWDAVNSPTGNYVDNAMLTNGQAATAPVTGTRPVSWPASTSGDSGLTVATSLVTSAIDGQPMAQMVFGGSYTKSGVSTPDTSVFGRFQYAVAAAAAKLNAIQAGDAFEVLAAVEIDSGNNIIQCPQLEYRWDGASNQNSDMRHAAAAQGDLPANKAIKMVLRTPPHIFTGAPAGTAQINKTAFLKSVTATYGDVAGTIRWGRAFWRKVLA